MPGHTHSPFDSIREGRAEFGDLKALRSIREERNDFPDTAPLRKLRDKRAAVSGGGSGDPLIDALRAIYVAMGSDGHAAAPLGMMASEWFDSGYDVAFPGTPSDADATEFVYFNLADYAGPAVWILQAPASWTPASAWQNHVIGGDTSMGRDDTPNACFIDDGLGMSYWDCLATMKVFYDQNPDYTSQDLTWYAISAKQLYDDLGLPYPANPETWRWVGEELWNITWAGTEGLGA